MLLFETALNKFIKKFVIPVMLKVDDKTSQALTLIGGHKKIIISFDIEFQNTSKLSYIREFGGIMFMKREDEWYYVGQIFVNFNNIEKYHIDPSIIRIIYSKYATITPKTKTIMETNEKVFNLIDLGPGELFNNETFNCIASKAEKEIIKHRILNNKPITTSINNILFNIYPKKLKHCPHLSSRINKQKTLYYADKLVKDRTLKKSNEKLFLKLFEIISDYTYFIVKGKRDIEAINNSYALIFGVPSEVKFSSVYDIEIYNKLSVEIWGNGKLETTYKGIINTAIYNEIKGFFDKIVIGQDAHNPVTDSIWTITIALCIGLQNFKYFNHQGLGKV